MRGRSDITGFSFLVGDEPPALAIERVLSPGVGEPQFVCRKKNLTGDPVPEAFLLVDFLVGPQGFSIIGALILLFYFRVTIAEKIREGVRNLKEKREARREARESRGSTSSRGFSPKMWGKKKAAARKRTT